MELVTSYYGTKTKTKCKTTIHKVHFNKILLYRAETWTWTKREESKIQATETKFLRAVMGKTKTGITRNAHIRDLMMEHIQNQIN
jgi:hypothetical protein